MTDAARRLAELAERLRALASELGGEDVADERVEELAREAAELAAEAGAEADRALREEEPNEDD